MEIDGAFYLVMDAETIEEQLRIIAETGKRLLICSSAMRMTIGIKA